MSNESTSAKICEYCENSFIPRLKISQRCCSKECSKSLYDLIRREGRQQLKLENLAKCLYCDKKFAAYKLGQKYCSNRCKTDFHLRNRYLKREKTRQATEMVPRNCLFCDKLITPTRLSDNVNQKFCTKLCKKEYYKKLYSQRNAEKRLATVKKCVLCDKEFVPKNNLRQVYCSKVCRNALAKRCYSTMSRLRKLLKLEKYGSTSSILGYSIADLRDRMVNHPNWNNVKDGNWHIDHIFPIKAFLEYNIKDVAAICAIDNLQPLAESENCSKGDNYDKDSFEAYLKQRCLPIQGNQDVD